MFKQLFIALTLLGFATPVFAENAPRILYMEVDGGKKLLSKKHPAYRHIFQETGDFLQENAGMQLIAERPFHERRSFREAIKDVEDINPEKIDAVVMVSVRRNMNRQHDLVKNNLVAMARIIDPYSLEVIDQIKVKSPTAKVHRGECGQDCRYEVGKRHVSKILPKFKKRLARSLHHLDFRPVADLPQKKPAGYTLTLKGFSDREVRVLENRIASLDGTRDLSSLRSQPHKPAYWLERRKKATSIRADLSDVLTRLDLQARIIETPSMVTLVKVKRNIAYAY